MCTATRRVVTEVDQGFKASELLICCDVRLKYDVWCGGSCGDRGDDRERLPAVDRRRSAPREMAFDLTSKVSARIFAGKFAKPVCLRFFERTNRNSVYTIRYDMVGYLSFRRS